MKTIRLRLRPCCALRVLNSSPMTGSSRGTARAARSRAALSWIRPPSTMMPPSSTSTLVRDRALVGDQVGRATCCELAATLEASCSILSSTASAFVDLRRDLEDGADFLALDGLERIYRCRRSVPGVGELAGEERHFLRDLDLGFLVVERDDRRRGDDVGVADRRAARAASRAKFVPVSAMRPTPSVKPRRQRDGRRVDGSSIARAAMLADARRRRPAD